MTKDRKQPETPESLEETAGEKAAREASRRRSNDIKQEFADAVVESAKEAVATADLLDALVDGVPGNQPEIRDALLERLRHDIKAALPRVVHRLVHERAAAFGSAAETGGGPSSSQGPLPPNGGGDDGNPGDGDEDDGGRRRRGVPLVQLAPTLGPRTSDERLWRVIKDRSNALAFESYARFIDQVLCASPEEIERPSGLGREINYKRRKLSALQGIRGRDAYDLLKLATEAFLLQEAGLLEDALIEAVVDDKLAEYEASPLSASEQRTLQLYKSNYLKELAPELPKVLPYFDLIRQGLMGIPVKKFRHLSLGVGCYGILPSRVTSPPLIELIWTYWYEESGVYQALKALALRFQNKKSVSLKNPLDRFATDPLRALNNLLWGFIEDEPNRLSLARRALEYQYEYGLSIRGKAVPKLESVESREKFLKAFHTLLHLCAEFFREDRDATIYTDGFPLLTALKEVHLLLAQGANNQYGDLPWTSRVEVLLHQWLLARPEMREFLGGRPGVPHEEPWIGQLETMRRLQGWGDAPVSLYRDLAMCGEQVLLAVRFGSWTQTKDANVAANWARAFRTEIQTYLHAYRSLTGVDLASDRIDFAPPALHLATAARR